MASAVLLPPLPSAEISVIKDNVTVRHKVFCVLAPMLLSGSTGYNIKPQLLLHGSRLKWIQESGKMKQATHA